MFFYKVLFTKYSNISMVIFQFFPIEIWNIYFTQIINTIVCGWEKKHIAAPEKKTRWENWLHYMDVECALFAWAFDLKLIVWPRLQTWQFRLYRCIVYPWKSNVIQTNKSAMSCWQFHNVLKYMYISTQTHVGKTTNSD